MNASKRKLRNDLLLILLILTIAILLAVGILLTRTEGTYVVVTVDGQELASYSLTEDSEIPIVSAFGENLLVIQNGQAFIRQADCKNQVCIHTHSIQYDGETIVCLPHHLVIRVRGEAAALDGVIR